MCTVSQRDEDFYSCKWHSLPLNIIVAVNAEALLTQIILSPLFSVSTGRDWAKTISLERAVTFSHIPDVSNTRIASGSPTCYLRFLNHIQMLDRCIDMDVFNQHSLWNGLVAGAAMLVISAFLLRLYFSPFSLVRGAFTRHRIFSPKRHSLVPVCTPYVTRQLAWVWELWQVIVVVAAASDSHRACRDQRMILILWRMRAEFLKSLWISALCGISLCLYFVWFCALEVLFQTPKQGHSQCQSWCPFQECLLRSYTPLWYK